ncbi:MAG: energy transducer TonB [Saprospiraceae bacterium]|jgi:TonB family protein|nr:energy transducer TonB [Saprospiraceae bacterium]
MRKSLHPLLWLFCCIAFIAVQPTAIGQTAGDTTIYQVVEDPARFPGCEAVDSTVEFKRQCASQQLLAFVYQNVRYPQEALEQNIEGSVVLTFVVEKDGRISSPKIIKDIGGGCGIEALRVIGAMNEAGVVWTPAKNKGQVVRSVVNLPVRFRIKEAPAFTITAYGDSIYTRFDEALAYEGGEEALAAYLDSRLKYPPVGNDSCRVGNIDIQLLVQANGDVRIVDLTDYNDLGFDFWYEAIDAATSTLGKWKPAVYQGRKVPSAFDISLSFTPTIDACKTVVEKFDLAGRLINEGATLFDQEKQEEGLAKMGEAIALFPNHAGLLLVRGQAYLDMNKLAEACADLSKARRIALVKWYDNILPLICR